MIDGNVLRRVNKMKIENLSVAIWDLFQTEAAMEKVAAYGGEDWGEWQKIRGLMVDDLLSSGVIEQWWPDGDGPSNNEDFDDMDVEEIYNLWIKIGDLDRKNNDVVTSLIKKEIRDIMGTSESLKMKKVNDMNETKKVNEVKVTDVESGDIGYRFLIEDYEVSVVDTLDRGEESDANCKKIIDVIYSHADELNSIELDPVDESKIHVDKSLTIELLEKYGG